MIIAKFTFTSVFNYIFCFLLNLLIIRIINRYYIFFIILRNTIRSNNIVNLITLSEREGGRCAQLDEKCID